MGIQLYRVEEVLNRFAIVFPLPTEAMRDDLADVWIKTLSGFSEDEVISACRELMRTLKRFPYPSDVVEAIKKQADGGQ